jgi:hypothetical protein
MGAFWHEQQRVGLRYWRYHRQHTALEHQQLRDAMESLAGREPTKSNGMGRACASLLS